MKKIIIAIDGHSSCGKSTMAKSLAKHFSYRYIDTGAMYRAVTFYALQNKLINAGKINKEQLSSDFEQGKITIDFKYNKELQKSETYLNNINIEANIRGIEVSSNVSPIATIDFVRENMVNLQRNMGKDKAIVMDGRDIGTNVFPDAELKIFLTADASVRAERRYKELINKGEKVSLQEIEKNIIKRDYIDSNRKLNPLVMAKDAILLDNTHINQEEQTQKAVQLVNEVLNGN